MSDISKKLRAVSNIKELSKELSVMIASEPIFLLWQSSGEKKVKVSATPTSQILVKDILTIDFKTHDKLQLSKGRNVYVHYDKDGILFKAKLIKSGKGVIQISMDSRFFLKERRVRPRFDVSDKRKICKITRTIELQNKEKVDSLYLNDIAERGCSIIANSGRVQNFQKESLISLSEFGSITLENPLPAIVKHTTPIEIKGDMNAKSFLIGIAFTEDFLQLPDFLQTLKDPTEP